MFEKWCGWVAPFDFSGQPQHHDAHVAGHILLQLHNIRPLCDMPSSTKPLKQEGLVSSMAVQVAKWHTPLHSGPTCAATLPRPSPMAFSRNDSRCASPDRLVSQEQLSSSGMLVCRAGSEGSAHACASTSRVHHSVNELLFLGPSFHAPLASTLLRERQDVGALPLPTVGFMQGVF